MYVCNTSARLVFKINMYVNIFNKFVDLIVLYLRGINEVNSTRNHKTLLCIFDIAKIIFSGGTLAFLYYDIRNKIIYFLYLFGRLVLSSTYGYQSQIDKGRRTSLRVWVYLSVVGLLSHWRMYTHISFYSRKYTRCVF